MTSSDVEKQPLLASGGAATPVSPTKGVAGNLFGASTTTLIILYYAACSSTMLVINKVIPPRRQSDLAGRTETSALSKGLDCHSMCRI